MYYHDRTGYAIEMTLSLMLHSHATAHNPFQFISLAQVSDTQCTYCWHGVPLAEGNHILNDVAQLDDHFAHRVNVTLQQVTPTVTIVFYISIRLFYYKVDKVYFAGCKW